LCQPALAGFVFVDTDLESVDELGEKEVRQRCGDAQNVTNRFGKEILTA